MHYSKGFSKCEIDQDSPRREIIISRSDWSGRIIVHALSLLYIILNLILSFGISN